MSFVSTSSVTPPSVSSKTNLIHQPATSKATLFGKSVPNYETFLLCKHSWFQCIRYHLIYHYTLSLHVNHMLLLHTYQLGLLLFVSAISFVGVKHDSSSGINDYSHYYPLYIFSGFLCIFEIIFSRCTLYGWSHVILVLLPLTILAQYLFNGILQQWNLYCGIIASLVTILSSLILQVIGHASFEEFQAPPAISHGFLAAPVLEWACFWLRIFPNNEIWDDVENERRCARRLYKSESMGERHTTTSTNKSNK